MESNPFSTMDIVSLRALANNMDDMTLFTFCKTDAIFRRKVCNDENFWKNRLEERYPLLKKFMSSKDTYRAFYMIMVYYISRLEEKYGIPYIPSPDFNPEKLYNLHDKTNIVNDALYFAANVGRLDLVKTIISKVDRSLLHLEQGVLGGIQGNHLNILKYLVNEGAEIGNYDLYEASKIGNLEMVKYLISKGALNFVIALRWASKAGKLNVVKYFVEEKGIRDDRALSLAKENNRKDVVEYLENI